MRLLEIDIYGFGKFQQQFISVERDLQVIFGENEAGKSTVYAFIHAILFGFPVKFGSISNYEPRQANNYGGSITIETARGEQLKIERVKKRYGSEVKVIREDGSIEGEEALLDMLSGLDRGSYEKIFAFNLDGLREVYRLSENEIGKFLFYTGMAGSDRLWDTEKSLTKQMEKYYKVSGSVPLLNVQMKGLKTSAQKLKEAVTAEEKHGELVLQQQNFNQQLQQFEVDLKAHQEKLIGYREQIRLLPLAIEKSSLEEHLKELGEGEFPAKGYERMNDYCSQLVLQENSCKQLQEKMVHVRTEIEAIEVDEKVLLARGEIKYCHELAVQMAVISQTMNEIETKLKLLESTIIQGKNELHVTASDEEIIAVDTSFLAKERVQQITVEQQAITKEQEDLSQKLVSEHQRLQELEQQIESYNSQLASTSVEVQEDEQEQSIDIKKYLDPILVLTGMLFMLTGWGQYWFIEPNSLALALQLSGVAVLVWIFALWRNYHERSSPKLAPEEQELLERNKRVQEELRFQLARKDDQMLTIQQIKTQLHKLDEEQLMNQEGRLQMIRQLLLPEVVIEANLLTAFEKVNQLKQLLFDQNRDKQLLASKQADFSRHQQTIDHVADKLSVSEVPSYQEKLQQFTALLTQAEAAKSQLANLEAKLSELEKDMEPVKLAITSLQEEQQRLLDYANCKTVEEYYKQAGLYDERKVTRSRLQELILQVDHITFATHNQSELEQMIQDEEEALELLERQIRETQSQLAKLVHETQHLQEAGTVENSAVEHQMNIEEFQSTAYEWMKLAVAKGILHKASRDFKEERLPTIVKQAEQHFRLLTDDQYHRLMFTDDGNEILLIDQFGEEFTARDLSRGTAEMLYVAFRLAFIAQLSRTINLPMIIDDSFVNFDKKRTKLVLQLLREFSQDQQVIFFTCHEHLLQYFDEDQITNMQALQLSLV